jgi:hypothetical protein
MKLFTCQSCGQLLYFENTACVSCGHRLGYLPARTQISTLEPEEGDSWRALADSGRHYRLCANAATESCNWMIAADSPDTLCLACRHNRTIPDLSDPANLLRWRKLELAKHALFYALLRFGLPVEDRRQNPEMGLTFDFLADQPDHAGQVQRVMTGHDRGVITINIVEADDAERERIRGAMGEPYRTLLGHVRHEVGHYYWSRLVDDAGRHEEFRALFGDERQDYGAALQAHYANGAPAGWEANFVSAYAAAHPWEDFAETWAHYLHIVDTLETARAFGMKVRPRVRTDVNLSAEVDFDPYRASGIEELMEAWLPVTLAVNCLNRSMGQPDLYPFVLSPTAIGKLGLVHGLISAARSNDKNVMTKPLPAAAGGDQMARG